MIRLFLILIFSGNLFAALQLTSAHQCRIAIENEKVNGERVRIQFATKLRTQEECRALAKMHMQNFEPNLVRSKRVSFLWNEKQIKTQNLITRVPKKSSSKRR